MTDEEYTKLQTEVAALRKQAVASEFGTIPKSIEQLRRLIDGAKSDDDMRLLYPLVLSECSRAHNDLVYLYFLRRSGQDLPDDPMTVSGMALSIAIINSSLADESLTAARRAVALARKQNRLIRYCAMNMARTAILLDDYLALAEAVKALVEDMTGHRSEDSDYEFDFVASIDQSRFDRQLLSKYMALRK